MPNIPTRQNNPGDLKMGGKIATYNSPAEGRAALYNDLTAKMSGTSSTGINGESNIIEFAKTYAPQSDGNDSLQYAANLANKLGVSPDTKIGSLKGRIDDFAAAISGNEGYQSPSGFNPQPFSHPESNPNPGGIDYSGRTPAQQPENKAASAAYLPLGMRMGTDAAPTAQEGADNAIGAAKGMLSTLQGADVLNTMHQMGGDKTDWTGMTQEQRKQASTPSNSTQASGQAGEQIAETLVPGMFLDGGAPAKILQKSAQKDITAVLSPTTKLNKEITQKIAPRLAQEGLLSSSREGLLTKVEGKLSDVGEALGNEYEKLPADAKVEVSNIFQNLHKKMDSLMVNGVVPSASQGEYGALQKVLKDMTDIGLSTSPDGTQVFADVGNVRKLRQLLDTGKTRFAFTDLDHASKGAQTFLANSIREEFSKSYPDIAKLNKDYHFWSNVSKVLGDAIDRKTGQSGLIRKGIGAGIGIASAKNPILGAGVGKLLSDFVSSPAWHTVSAVVKTKLANALSGGDVAGAEKIIQPLLKAAPVAGVKAVQGLLSPTPQR